MFPLRDHNRPQRTPVLTYTLIGINVAVYLYQASLPEPAERALFRELALKPAFVTAFVRGQEVVEYEEPVVVMGRDGRPIVERAVVPVRLTFWNSIFPFISSMFLHGGWAHLLGNMWFLHIFADNVEDRMRRARFLLFYLVSGFAASLLQVLFSPRSSIPCVGASGAISGVLGAYTLLYPHARVLSLVPLGFFLQVMEIPAFVFLLIWFAIQVVSGVVSQSGAGGVAWWAHIGGFLAGLAWVWIAPPRPPRDRLGGRFRDVPFTLEGPQ